MHSFQGLSKASFTSRKTVMALGLASFVALGASVTSYASTGTTGNGAPSGAHFNLNLHGVSDTKNFTATSDGHNIFAPLNGHCQIDLQQGTLGVINSDCVNSKALLQLPNPDNGTGDLAYSVYVRAVTKGAATLDACFTDTTTNETFCNAGTLSVSLSKVTPPKFTNVSNDLLQVCVSGSLQPLFGNSLYNYFWNYDNQGLRLAQMRFYPIATTAIGGTCTSTTTP
jgi:hypothetical protein